MGESPEVSHSEGSISAALSSGLALECVHQGHEMSNELLSMLVLLLHGLGHGVQLELQLLTVMNHRGVELSNFLLELGIVDFECCHLRPEVHDLILRGSAWQCVAKAGHLPLEGMHVLWGHAWLMCFHQISHLLPEVSHFGLQGQEYGPRGCLLGLEGVDPPLSGVHTPTVIGDPLHSSSVHCGPVPSSGSSGAIGEGGLAACGSMAGGGVLGDSDGELT